MLNHLLFLDERTNDFCFCFKYMCFMVNFMKPNQYAYEAHIAMCCKMLSHLLQYVYMYVCVKAAVDVVLYRDLLILYDVHITGENVSWISITGLFKGKVS